MTARTPVTCTSGLPVVPCDFNSVQTHGVRFKDCPSTLIHGQQVVLCDDTGEPGLRRYATVSRRDIWRMRIHFEIDYDTQVH